MKESKDKRRMPQDKGKRTGGLPPRYTFALNPYKDTRFSECPVCRARMNMRKFALFIHIDNWGPLSLGKTCRYCPRCELIIAHQNDLESELCVCFERLSPEVIGRKYFVLGTVKLPVWKKGLSVKRTPLQETLEHVAQFKTYRTIAGSSGGWVPIKRAKA